MKHPFIILFLTPLLALSLFTTASAQLTDTITDPAASTCVNLTKDLRTGSKDSTTDGQVSDLQFFLSDKGYLKTDPTGYFGPATLAAVKAFQGDNSVPQTGNVGPLTRSKVSAVSCSNDEPVSTTVNQFDPLPPTSIGNLSVNLSFAGKGSNGSQVSGTNVTDVNPMYPRTWSWTTTGAASVSARWTISGANCAISAYGDLKEENWQPWLGTAINGNRFNGSNSRVLGSQYYGCTIEATYKARNTQNQIVSSTVKVVFSESGSGVAADNELYYCNGVVSHSPCTVNTGGVVCGQPKMPTCAAGMACAQVMPQPKTYSTMAAMSAAGATFIHNGACDGATSESVVTNSSSNTNVGTSDPSFANLTFTPATVSQSGAVNMVWNTSNTTATDGSGVKVTCDNAVTGPSASTFAFGTGAMILPISGDRNFSMATHFPGTYKCTAEIVRNGMRVGQIVTRTLTITQASAVQTAPTSAPGVALFYADNNSPRVGDKINLYWNAEGGANNCTVNGSQPIAVGVAVQFNVTIPVNNAQGGTFETTFTGETRYSLFCTNSIGSSATKSFVVKPATLVGGATIEESPSTHTIRKYGSELSGTSLCVVPVGGTGCTITTSWRASNDTSSVALKSFGGVSESTLSTSLTGKYTFGTFTPDITKSWSTGYTLTTQPGGKVYKRILGAECTDKTFSSDTGALISPATIWNGTSCVVVGGDTTPATINSFSASPTQIASQMSTVSFMWSASATNCSVTHKELDGSTTKVTGYDNSSSGFTTMIAEDAINVGGNIARYTLVCAGTNGQLSSPRTVDILFPNKAATGNVSAATCSVTLDKSSVRTDEGFIATIKSTNLLAVQYFIVGGNPITDTQNFANSNGTQPFDPISTPGTYSAKITGLKSDGTKINCSNSPVTFTVTAAPAAQTSDPVVQNPVVQNPVSQPLSSSCSVSAPSSIFFTAAFDANITSSNMSSVSYSLDNATWQPFSTKNGAQTFPANAFPDPGVADSPKAYTLYFKGVSSNNGAQEVSCSPLSMTMSVKH